MSVIADVNNRRNVKTKFIDPGAQIRYFGLFSFAWMGFSVVILLVAAELAQRGVIAMGLNAHLPEDVIEAFVRLTMRSFWVAIACVVGSGACSFAHSIFHSHRLYGPLVPLRRAMAQVKAGDYTARVSFRKGDELLHIMHEFNALAAALEARYGSAPGERVTGDGQTPKP